MKRFLTAVAANCLIFLGTQALASDTANSTMSKSQMIRQIAGCMKKRMAADRNRSYNEALKGCKSQIHPEKGSAPTGALVADTQAKP